MTDGIVAFTTRTECGSPVRGHAKSFHVSGTVADAVDGKGVTLRRAAAAHSPERTVFTRFIPPQAPRALAVARITKGGTMSRATRSARMFWSLCQSFENLCRLPV